MDTSKEIIYAADYKPGWIIDGHTLIAMAINGEPFRRASDGNPEPLNESEKQNPPSDCERVRHQRGNLWWVKSPEGR